MSATVIIPTLDPDSDMVARCLEAIGPDVDVEVIHDTNRDGFVATCTRGADQATGDVLVFLNDDTIPQPGWLDAIEAAVTDDRIVGGLMVYPDGNIQHSGVFFRRRNGTLEAYNRQTTAPSGEVPAITGACLAITRKRWDDLGGFDAGYLNGYEDVDLCLRHREAGGHVWYAAQCVVVHLESQSPGRFTHAQQNVALLQQRWGHLPI
jgi:GT2 family glycosyltransferase